ncbi:hypothetical protein HH1059_22680 [Halorhodospira halochloris]|uniref:Uncharacterized protein n=1 Tax=Halorhodospira halochloris TaxID=1052 RepID=A0A2Z6EZX4_HALHR|nr:hypothetical protein [Halorhodospira halochloris]BBE11168.1 hypothetical protein HH1059_22680 [Halorhodospira halochloris]
MNPPPEALWQRIWRHEGASKNFADATIRPGVEDAVDPSLESSWRLPWR